MDASFDLKRLEAAYLHFVEDLIRRSGLDPSRFPLDLAPKDEMFFKAVLPGYPDGRAPPSAVTYSPG